MTRLKLVLFALSACLMFPANVHAQACNPTCPLSISPTTAQQGQPVTIRVGLDNHSDQERLITASIGILSTASWCSQFDERFSVTDEVPAGQLVFVSHTVPAPKCTSTYDVGRFVISFFRGEHEVFLKDATLTVAAPACSPTSPGFTPSLSVAPTTAEEGEPVTVTVGVTSCFSSAKVFTANVNITPISSACASSASAFQVSGIIQADQTATFTHTFPAPKCASTYDVKMPGAKTATLKVVPTSGLTLTVASPLNNSTVTNPVHVGERLLARIRLLKFRSG